MYIQSHSTVGSLFPKGLLACILAIYAGAQSAENLVKPQQISIHTWVREDIFAGLVARDTVAFERGVRKLDRFLLDNPNDANGLAWKVEVYGYRMRADREAGDDAAYQRDRAEAQDYGTRALALRKPDEVGPWVIIGGMQIFNARYAATAGDSAALYTEGLDLLGKAQEAQRPIWDQLPAHMRGELWSEMAFAYDQLGEQEKRKQIATAMIAKLQGSPYEARGRRWLKLEKLSYSETACISCHEPGRLQTTLARLGVSAR